MTSAPVDAPVPREGDELPPLAVPVTRTLIVAGAIASRDFQDVHHDAEAARDKGSPDIFMNILTTNGLVGRYVTEWAGPYARLRRVAIRLGAPNYPGDTLTLTGRVTSVTASGGTGTGAPDASILEAGIAVLGRNSLGAHVTGAVTLLLTIRTRDSESGAVQGADQGPGQGAVQVGVQGPAREAFPDADQDTVQKGADI
ncbi:MaoC family dehydratase [Streptomyces axinellae]|uniref:MaoC-like domain-containing protein n=1 Tax=Streptomyces axinellae TaxID=552788 RepID=A0ABP6CGX7_9ACTN